MHKLSERTYVNADSTRIVPEGSTDAAFLLGDAGSEISDETAQRLGLSSGGTDLESMKKAELVAYANGRGVDSSGTVAEIRERLEASDSVRAETTGGTADVAGPGATADVVSPA